MRAVLFLLLASLAFSQELIDRIDFTPDYDQPTQRLSARAPFRAIGLLASEHFHVRLRTSLDGLTWTDWQEAPIGHEGGNLFWFEQGARHLELISPRPLRAFFINPKQLPAAPKSPTRSATPTVVPRAAWGCGPECNPKDTPVFSPVTHLIVHHSAGANTSSNWASVIRSIWVLHVQGNGWNDIGYNFLIDPNGVIYEGRQGGDGVIGAHFSGVNTNTMGVCMVGTYTSVTPTSNSFESLRGLLAFHASKWQLDPTGQTTHAPSRLTLNVISGHRDAGLSPQASGTTECPGTVLYSYLPALRAQVASDVFSCRVNLPRRNYCTGSAATSLEVPIDNPNSCAISVVASTPWLTVSEGRIQVAANPSNQRRSADLLISGQVINVTQAESGVASLPCVSRSTVVNSASFDARPIALSSIATVFGESLSRDGGTTRVLLNNIPATVVAATPNQVNFILPSSVQTGSARLVIERDGVRSPESMFWVNEVSPGLYVAQNFDDSQINSPSTPAKPGSALIVYLTGIGTNRSLPWSISIDVKPTPGLFLGNTPGFLGLAQANLLLPSDLTPGPHTLTITVSGVPSNPLPIYLNF